MSGWSVSARRCGRRRSRAAGRPPSAQHVIVGHRHLDGAVEDEERLAVLRGIEGPHDGRLVFDRLQARDRVARRRSVDHPAPELRCHQSRYRRLQRRLAVAQARLEAPLADHHFLVARLGVSGRDRAVEMAATVSRSAASSLNIRPMATSSPYRLSSGRGGSSSSSGSSASSSGSGRGAGAGRSSAPG